MRFYRTYRSKGGEIIHICKNEELPTVPVTVNYVRDKMYCGNYKLAWLNRDNTIDTGIDDLEIWELGVLCKNCVRSYYKENKDREDVDLDFNILDDMEGPIWDAFHNWKEHYIGHR